MSRLELPEAPPELKGPVKAWSQPIRIPTYPPLPPDRNPMFLDRRVYQGSSGRVYPLPFVDRISEERVERTWQAVHLENEHLRVMVLPELGGRIHVLRDRATGRDLVYRQDVIRPALVGLAGPWVSGGIEFNWPQHHRPATTMPTDVHLEEERDGSWTAWFGDHDPIARMKGMHGVCLRPGDARMELRVRLYNRTPFVQTFLWWANAAVEVHEDYQSFFPPDVRLVADHARRAVTTFPRCNGTYYGIDYGRRAREGIPASERPPRFVPRPGRPTDDLSWYANIPVPTSYMAVGSAGDFMGGYDHAAGVGIVHVADHHVAPGKKQWTWGNHEFGYAWDRNLTDPDERGVHRPYVEIMSGVYTDNQPDFSFLGPGETRTFTQLWYPLHGIGPPRQAGPAGALSLELAGGLVRVGVSVPVTLERATVRLTAGDRVLAAWTRNLVPAVPMIERVALPPGIAESALRVEVLDARGRGVLSYQATPAGAGEPFPAATEPPPPEAIATADELYLTGVHLDQYRHATRSPEPYWSEGLRRDPLDSRCNTALGFWRLRRGEFRDAERHFRDALRRLQARNANPSDGEPFYGLGLTLRFLGRNEAAQAAFAKGAWNAAWAGPCHHALAELACAGGEPGLALDHLDRAIARDADNLRARGLRVSLLDRLGREPEAGAALGEILARDPLDAWGRHLDGRSPLDAQVVLDLVLDQARAGLDREALALLEPGGLEGLGAAPMIHYTAAWLADRLGERALAARRREAAARASPDYCFPARLEDIGILEAAMAAAPGDGRAPCYLGNLLYARGRHEEAIALWERAVVLDPAYPVVWRNLGIGRFNVRRDPAGALAAYDRALAADPTDARIVYERDQLRKRTGAPPAERLAELEGRPEQVGRRDDLTVELCTLLLGAGRAAEALRTITGRRFQPWEGGEGLVLEQHTRARLALARECRARGDLAGAREHLETALRPPESLGEARHPLASAADVQLALGDLCAAAGDVEGAQRWFTAAAGARGDFQSMSVQELSDMTWWSALALRRLGRTAEAEALSRSIEDHATALRRTPARIDYFATSLPSMLLFEDDLQQRQEVAAELMLAQARLGLGDRAGARTHLEQGVLSRDPAHARAGDLLRELAAGWGPAGSGS
jgi:tetratricopeptide (TPR) repeat protein